MPTATGGIAEKLNKNPFSVCNTILQKRYDLDFEI